MLAIVADFAALCDAEYDLIELSPGIIEQARLLLERYVLRAYDAIQLASARIARNRLLAARLAAPIFLAADDRLLKAAQAEGLAVDNPNLHP